MIINLSQIKPSPKQIRTTWSDDKLDELAQSIEYMGLIVPIKVRPTDNNHYEIVYGHRRVAALRIAGFTETDAIVEGVDDTDDLIQELIENVQREDMNQVDLGYAIALLRRETGWSFDQIEKRGIMNHAYAHELVKLVNEPRAIQDIIRSADGIGSRHVREVREVLPLNDDREVIIKKASEEGLNTKQTRQVAESVAATKDPKMRERLIDAPYSPYTHDPEYAKERADRYGEHDPIAIDKTPSLDEAWKLTAEVSMIVDFIKKSRQMYEEVIKMDDLGKFSPEARPFIIGKLKSTVKQIEKVIDQLEG